MPRADHPFTLADIDRLITVLHRLVDLGNTVITIEHNPDIVKEADWAVDLARKAAPAGDDWSRAAARDARQRARIAHRPRAAHAVPRG